MSGAHIPFQQLLFNLALSELYARTHALLSINRSYILQGILPHVSAYIE